MMSAMFSSVRFGSTPLNRLYLLVEPATRKSTCELSWQKKRGHTEIDHADEKKYNSAVISLLVLRARRDQRPWEHLCRRPELSARLARPRNPTRCCRRCTRPG